MHAARPYSISKPDALVRINAGRSSRNSSGSSVLDPFTCGERKRSGRVSGGSFHGRSCAGLQP